MRSAWVGIFLTCVVATVIALVVAYMFAFPLALFTGGDPGRGWAIGFFLGLVGSGIWAVRTSRSLLRDEVSRSDVFREPWPAHGSPDGLMGLQLLDRRGQPGPAAAWAHDVDGVLRGGERAQRQVVVQALVDLYLVVEGDAHTAAILLDPEGDEVARAMAGRPPLRVPIPSTGIWRVVLERHVDAGPLATPVHAWWVANEARA